MKHAAGYIARRVSITRRGKTTREMTFIHSPRIIRNGYTFLLPSPSLPLPHLDAVYPLFLPPCSRLSLSTLTSPSFRFSTMSVSYLSGKKRFKKSAKESPAMPAPSISTRFRPRRAGKGGKEEKARYFPTLLRIRARRSFERW